ncbi:hypothetical protein [uncultured Duncaniella sp.]|uniref:hypothetical protein n=1 Tax=uncultured Duncaniella sp. TaxID=2768039 RepID=UPI0025AA2B6C|nr:hypothetical protein [uncultured Duncaniella sp.]
MITKNLYLLIGPSGSGKTTLMTGLKKLGYSEAISYTTRPCRGPDDIGSYRFVSEKIFHRMVCDGVFIEHVRYCGNYYGNTYQELDNSNFIIVEVTGAKTILKKYKYRPIKVIGIVASQDNLKSRLSRRGDDAINRMEADQSIFDAVPKLADYVIESTTPAADLLEALSFMSMCGEHMPSIMKMTSEQGAPCDGTAS